MTPHWILHKAGVPAPGHSRKMLLVQINQRRKPTPSTELFERQYAAEPTLKQEWGFRVSG